MTNILPWRIECRSTYPFFEPIAAFNSEKVAIAYAASCRAANPTYAYRVVKAGKIRDTDSVECPHCHWGFNPAVIAQHIREKH
jgi:hypothetical protein